MEQAYLVEPVSIFIGLLLFATLSAILTRALRFPYTVGLLLLGILLAFVATKIPALQPLQQVRLTPEVILYLLIPTLIFEAAININASLLIKHLPIIIKLAVTGVLLSTLLIACIVYLTTPLSFSLALLFGALISATDPVAVIALFKELGASERLTSLVDGESLFSNASAIALFGIIFMVIQSGEPWSMGHFGSGLMQFVLVFFGGLSIGCIVGGLCFLTIRMERESSLIQIALSTVVAYVAFIIAEHVMQVSGIMAVLAAGLIGTWLAERGFSKEMQNYVRHYWEYAAFVANSFVFLLLGFAEEGLVVDLVRYQQHTAHLLWAVIAILLARAIVVYGLISLHNKLFKDTHIDLKHQTVIFWGGLRGAIPLALVLSLPKDLPQRSLLLDMTLAVVLFTLVVQGTTIKLLLKRFRLCKA